MPAPFEEGKMSEGLTREEYLDRYGTCPKVPCPCVNSALWVGRNCPHWVPLGFQTQEEHLAWFMWRANPENKVKP